jgi:hypothetical protein
MIEILLAAALLVVLCFGFVVFLGAPFVPTRRRWAEAALNLIKLQADDVVVDLGSGNGAILKLLAQRGIRSVGYEINPILYLLSKLSTIQCVPKPSLRLKNFWVAQLPPDSTVVYVFAVQRDSAKLVKYLTAQAKLVKNRQLKVITFGLRLPNQKPIKQTDGAFLYNLDFRHFPQPPRGRSSRPS